MFSCLTSCSVHTFHMHPVCALVGVEGGADDQ